MVSGGTRSKPTIINKAARGGGGKEQPAPRIRRGWRSRERGAGIYSFVACLSQFDH